MSHVIMIVGPPSRGKTTMLCHPESEGLPPGETFIFDFKGMPLPISNYAEYVRLDHIERPTTADRGAGSEREFWDRVVTKLHHINESMPDIKYVWIDDFDYIIAGEMMARLSEKGYDKWNDTAKHAWVILRLAAKLREDLTVFIAAHEDTYETQRVMKTFGRLLRERLEPEGLLTIILWAEAAMDEKTNRVRYHLSTNTDGIQNAKSPAGMFPPEMPNDALLVARRVREYYGGIKNWKESEVL